MSCWISSFNVTSRTFSDENLSSLGRLSHVPSEMLFDSKDNCLMCFPMTLSMRVFNSKWELIASFKISPTMGGNNEFPAQPRVLLTKVRWTSVFVCLCVLVFFSN